MVWTQAENHVVQKMHLIDYMPVKDKLFYPAGLEMKIKWHN